MPWQRRPWRSSRPAGTGCGVFGNDPSVVAAAFAAGLARAETRFDHVVFAVLDLQLGTPTHAAFTRALGHSSLLEER